MTPGCRTNDLRENIPNSTALANKGIYKEGASCKFGDIQGGVPPCSYARLCMKKHGRDFNIGDGKQ